MPRVVYAASIESITGKLGGSILKRVKSGPIVHRGQRGRQPRSAKQQETRGFYNTYAGKWRTLTETQRRLWNKAASVRQGRMSGFNAYLQANVRLRKAGHADLVEISAPAPSPSTPDHVHGLEAWPSTTQNTIVWTAPTGTDVWVEVFFAFEVGYSLKDKEKWSLVETVRADVGQVVHTHGLPTTIPMLYRARSIDTWARLSPWTERTYGATIGARYDEDFYGGGFYA